MFVLDASGATLTVCGACSFRAALPPLRCLWTLLPAVEEKLPAAIQHQMVITMWALGALRQMSYILDKTNITLIIWFRSLTTIPWLWH